MENPFTKKEAKQTQKNFKEFSNKNQLVVKKTYVVLAAVIMIALFGFSLISIYSNVFSDKNKVEEELTTIEKLSKILLIPVEAPTIGEINDIETLKKGNPEFYKNAQKGDKLILFKEIAVIFREELNLIVNMAAIDTSGK